MGGCEVTKPESAAWMLSEEKPEFVLCEDEKLARFLNGLIIHKRGAKGEGIPEPESILSNNIVLRKLKIALNLQAEELLEMLRLSDVTLSKHELSALFRRPDHKHYRECSDQLLGNVLVGMEQRYRNSQA